MYGPKLNSLLSFAERNPETFPKGGMRTLEDAVGALLGIPIHYYARIDFVGFIAMVDAVGGVDINVKQTLRGPKHYDGYGLPTKGFRITEGQPPPDRRRGARLRPVRKGVGETDFTRAARQQEVIVALRSSVSSGGSLFWRLPTLLDAVGQHDPDRCPDGPPPRARGDRRRGRLARCRPRGHRPPAGGVGQTRATAHRRSRTSRGSRRSPRDCSRPPAPRPIPWPTPKATKAPKATPSSRLLRTPAPPAEPREERIEVRVERRAAARLSRTRKPSATAWSSQPSKASQ